jgi:hypothetical protein
MYCVFRTNAVIIGSSTLRSKVLIRGSLFLFLPGIGSSVPKAYVLMKVSLVHYEIYVHVMIIMKYI